MLTLLSKLFPKFFPPTLVSALKSRPRKRRFGWYPTNVRMAFLSLQVLAEPTSTAKPDKSATATHPTP